MLTQCGGWHSNEVRTFDSVLVQLGQEGNSLNSFTQALRGEDVQGRSDLSHGDREVFKHPFRSNTCSVNTRTLGT